MRRRAFLKALLAVPVAGMVPLTAQAVTVPLPSRYVAQILFTGNLIVASPRYSRVLYGISEP